ncbi:phospho protein phosphatase [Pseudomassariella vexata]|uniref:Phospho protein phosphatase n=1 Tax=Pseudomassariella vexata TaxID=1141098 RepID=A0A1Y2DHR9_9PEZI|nr:phospho protein phosphatase [Pseudomassariella vexata]ORY58770.1 phospho protein phosphatase [Pseudomassariella vexata]
MRFQTVLAGVATLATSCSACDSCFGPINRVEHVRQVKRMQSDAHNATYGPTRALEWGQLNFLHTTDTHGWLEGHLKETNYGADWGDFVSFAAQMKAKARELGVDLLLVDTGDLHDGAGLSDSTDPDGEVSNIVFEKLDYDLLTIGNHELYLADVAYQDYNEFSKFWGEKYLTSNVQILNPNTSEYEYLGNQYRHFTTENGLRILAFGILFDFTGNANVTRVTPAETMVNETWFVDAINTSDPVDLFLLIGHNTALPQDGTGTFQFVHDAIRNVHPSTPIQIFGGHSHIRDFVVYDEASTALESGRYCETLGWLSMSGFSKNSSGYTGVSAPEGVPAPSRKATNTSLAPWNYSRRYLDWNRLTFEYHAIGSQTNRTFDTQAGLDTTSELKSFRAQLNLTDLYRCAPQYWCMSCAEFNSSGSIYSLLTEALSSVVVNSTRADKSRLTLVNTGSIRFDLHKGPFTHDDSFIVSPFVDIFMYIPDVPYSLASGALDYLNQYGSVWKRDNLNPMPLPAQDSCIDPFLAPMSEMKARDPHAGHSRRQTVELTQGYITTDAFGTDGDDTVHSEIPSYSYPHFFQAMGGFRAMEVPPTCIQSEVLEYLGDGYSETDASYYIDESFSTQSYLPLFVQQSELFQKNINNCTIY